MSIELVGKEDYFVLALVKVSGRETFDVPCKIYLPERVHGRPVIVLKPSDSGVADLIVMSGKCEIYAKIIGYNKNLETEIIVPEIRFSRSESRHWERNLVDGGAYGEPENLNIIRHYSIDDKKKNTDVIFWVSSNRMLSPSLGTITNYTGSVERRQANEINFDLGDGLSVGFNRRFATKVVNQDLIQWFYLSANIRLSGEDCDVGFIENDLLQKIDDILLISSFASDRRTACLGWEICGNGRISTTYRGNYEFPVQDEDESFVKWIIDITQSKKFVQHAYSKFRAAINKKSLRTAMVSVVPVKKKTVESSFLSLFAALEGLVLDFRRDNHMEFVLPANDWRNLKSSLESLIKNFEDSKLSAAQRSMMYKKIGELNRVPIRDAFEEFCAKNGVYIHDLWPVFASKSVVSLSDIRNKIAHGDLSCDSLHALSLAENHLRCILIRVVLRLLDWNISDSSVGLAGLHTRNLLELQIDVAQKVLADSFN